VQAVSVVFYLISTGLRRILPVHLQLRTPLSIFAPPLRPNEQALLTLFPSPGVDVGLGPGERARAAEEIDGGLVGLIIDARGRPFTIPTNEAERQAQIMQWMQAIGA